MKRLPLFLPLTGVLALCAPPAAACGGCFAPSGAASQVTAHRMAIAINTERTVLWDQFEYSGAPEDFVWVLPVAGSQDVRVELSDNDFFLAMTQVTAISLFGPGRDGGGSFFGCGDSPEAVGPVSDPVTVFEQRTVGPYETVTIGSEDAGALLSWLQDRQYAVSDTLRPTIEHYVERNMNFVALRLAPGESVSRMQPVRVTTPGVNTTFPLRMIAAGIGDSVALELFVIGEGRWEAQNFPNAVVDRAEIVYDWETLSYNYDELASDIVTGGHDEGVWLTEFANTTQSYLLTGPARLSGGDEIDVSQEWAFATEGLSDPTLTRMRTRMPAALLERDLTLRPSEAGIISGFIPVARDVNFGATVEGLRSRSASLPLVSLVLFGLVAGTVVGRRWQRRRSSRGWRS